MRILIIIFLLLFGSTIQTNSQTQTPANNIIYDDTTRFNSIEDVLKLPAVKDKVVYVDIWGTRCIPCIEEFPSLSNLKNRYKNKPVVFVYLKSPYGFDDSKEWKEMISKYNVEGIHISMSIKFYSGNFWEKYKNKYTEERSYGIPTYLIINKKGKIVDFDAPRPSKTEKLFPLLDKEI